MHERAMLGSTLPGGLESALWHAVSTRSAFDEAVDSAGARLYFKRSREPLPSSPLNPNKTAKPRPTTKPTSLNYADWIGDVLGRRGGVVASVPAGEGREARSVALDTSVASGNALYWASNLLENQYLFAASRCSVEGSGTHASAVTLQDGVPGFFPEGDVYGIGRSEMDSVIDAGFTVEVKESPYTQRGGVFFEKENQREAACAREISTMLLMTEAGVAPCVLAAFYAHREDAAVISQWQKYTKPTQLVGTLPGGERKVSALVVVSQVSTFSLGDLMEAAQTGSPAKREHAAGVLRTAVPLVMEKVRALSEVRGGYGTVKANMTVDSVIFCADLQPSEDSWTLGGVGHLPVSREHVDGIPKIRSFPALLCRRIRAAQYDVDTATVLHSLLLLSFSSSAHGAAAVALRDHFAQEGSDFKKAALAAAKKQDKAAAFLTAVSNNADVASIPELRDAMIEVAEQTSAILRAGGGLPSEESMFPRLVSFVTHSVEGKDTWEADDAEDAETLDSLEAVKRARDARVAAAVESRPGLPEA